jgi:hypothetical protein
MERERERERSRMGNERPSVRSPPCDTSTRVWREKRPGHVNTVQVVGGRRGQVGSCRVQEVSCWGAWGREA